MSVSLDDFKAHLNIRSSTNDDELLDMLDAATEIVEGMVGPLDDGTVTETHYGVTSDVLVLQTAPVATLTAVSVRSGADSADLPVGDFTLDPATGIVRVAWGGRFAGTFTVTYTTGRGAVPSAIRQAVLIIGKHLWDTQRGAAPVGPLATADDETLTPGMGYAIPNRARELLAPYVQITLA